MVTTLTKPTANPGEVFYARSATTRTLRTVLRAVERFAPNTSVRLATRIFLTPPSSSRARRLRWSPPWHAERLQFERATITLHRHELDDEPVRPLVVLLHGWAGHAGQMLPLAESLIEHGFAPVLLEAPAHGTNAGTTTAMPQFARALEYTLACLTREGREVRGLIGHSAGAMACAFVVGRTRARYRTVLIAPPESPEKYVSLFGHVFGLSARTQAAIQQRIESNHGMLMSQFEARRVAEQVHTPTLLVHDRDDQAHSIVASERFAAHCPHAQLIETQGLGHTRLLRDARVVAQIAAFVSNA